MQVECVCWLKLTIPDGWTLFRCHACQVMWWRDERQPKNFRRHWRLRA
jgi:hypothetical protein